MNGPFRRIHRARTRRAERRPSDHRLLREIDALSEQVRVLSREVRTDPLTGLANRRGWDEQLTRELARARRSQEAPSIALVDLDDFKAFNDAHGHQAGDRLLVEAAAAWSRHLRDVDTLCRWGGDEFALLLPACAPAQAHDVVARLSRSTPSQQTCAAGLAGWDGQEAADALLARADSALLDAKRCRLTRAPAASPRPADT